MGMDALLLGALWGVILGFVTHGLVIHRISKRAIRRLLLETINEAEFERAKDLLNSRDEIIEKDEV